MYINPKSHDALFKWLITSHDQLLLINQWLDFYKKVPPQTFQQIKREFNMELVETTISEHIFNQGLAKGHEAGKEEGKAEGITEGLIQGVEQQMALLRTLHQEGILSESQLKNMLSPLEMQLKTLQH